MSRDSYIHIAQTGSPGARLLFLFHGTGGDERQLLPLAGEVAPGAAIVSPRGDVSEYGAARFFRRTGEGVYDMDDLALRTRKMAAFVKAHRDAAGGVPVLGLGYSNGANILASVLFAEPALFDAAVLMHPLIPFAPKIDGDLAGRHILITAGRRDPICPPDLTARLEAYLKAARADVAVEWHDGGHELRPGEADVARRLFSSYPGQTSKAERRA